MEECWKGGRMAAFFYAVNHSSGEHDDSGQLIPRLFVRIYQQPAIF
jgi:hypothetical protein